MRAGVLGSIPWSCCLECLTGVQCLENNRVLESHRATRGCQENLEAAQPTFTDLREFMATLALVRGSAAALIDTM